MKFLLSVSTASDVIAPTEAVIDISEERAKTFLKRRLAYKAIEAYDPDLDEIVFWNNDCDFVEVVSDAYPTSIAAQLGREDEDATGPENEQYEVLPRLFNPRYERARMDTGHLIVDEYGMFFRAYPHHGEYLLTTGLIPWAEIEKVASGLEEREGHSIEGVGAVCDHCVTDYERTEKSSPLTSGEFYVCARCNQTFDEPAQAADEDEDEDEGEVAGEDSDEDHGLGPVLLEKPARVWIVCFTALLQVPGIHEGTEAVVRGLWADLFENYAEVLDWGHDMNPKNVSYRLWRVYLCVLLKSEETELRGAHALSMSTSGGKISPRSWLKLLEEEHDWIHSTHVLGEISEHELAAGYREGQMFVPTPREGFHVQGLPVCVTCLKPGEREAIQKEQAISPGLPFRCMTCGVRCVVPKDGEGS